MDEKILEEIIRRLDVIIKLLSLNSIRDKPVKEQIIFLYNIGLETSDIARLLGKSKTHVSKEISLYKKQLQERTEEETS